jgi:hypothetical protein
MYRISEKHNFLSVLIALLAVLFSILLTRGHVGFASMSFGFLSEANKLSNGYSIFQLWPGEPFGYQIIISVITRFFTFSTVQVAYYLNILCFFFTLYYYAKLLFSINFFTRKDSIAILIIYSFYSQSLWHATNIWVEAPFTLITMVFFANLVNSEKGALRRNFALLFFAILSMYFRYIGIVLVGVSVVYVLHCFCRKKINIYHLFVLAIFSISLIFPLLYRNYQITGVITGHALSVAPAYRLDGALVAVIFESMRWLPIALPNIIFTNQLYIAYIISFIFMVVMTKKWFVGEKFEVELVKYYPSAYIVIFAIFESITRLDLVNYRFIHPILPFVFIIFCVNLKKINQLKIFENKAPNFLVACAIVILCIACVKVYKGSKVSDFNYSPNILDYISKNIPPDGAILTNRFGDQVGMFRTDIKVHILPFTDQLNGGYTEAYGVKLLDKNSYNKFRLNNKINHVVFFMGVDGRDSFLSANEYGEFISDYVKNHCFEECKVLRFNDGFIFSYK